MENNGDSTTTLGLGEETEVPTEVPTETPSTEVVPSPEIRPMEIKEPSVVDSDSVEPVSIMTNNEKKKTRRKRKRESSNSSSSSNKTLHNRISKMEKELRRLTKKVDSMEKHMPRCPSSV